MQSEREILYKDLTYFDISYKDRIKARGPLHAADVPREKLNTKKLAEQENETPLSKNGLEKTLLGVSSMNYSMKCIMPSQKQKTVCKL